MNPGTLLATKLRIPEARPAQVARPRLVERLTEGLRLARHLTLVSAPPGFGKTTLLREWVATAGLRLGWLTLDEGDNDPARFLHYLSAAAGQSATEGELATAQDQLIRIINNIATTDQELLLVLDDYQEIRNFGVHELVAFLLAHQPPGLHLAIGTREDPPLPLPRLRARDQVTEIRARALRFTPDETAAFLNRTLRLGLSEAVVAALAARTEGWITALQLAGLALASPFGSEQQPNHPAEFVAAFAGDDRYIVDYLVAEVLERQVPALREFLRQTAILERLCAPLCQAITGREDAQMLLERLEAANLFLAPLDNRREWYRYHVLFAEVLRLTLAAPEQAELHRRAAGWCDANEHPDLAVHHARRAAELAASTAVDRYPTAAPAAGQPLIEPLSEREIEVLQLIAAGLSNQEIAGRLVIAPGTVKRHINNIYGKLQVGSRTQAIAVARELRIL